MHRSLFAPALAAALITVGTATARADVMLGQVDDFQDGTTQNWVEGAPSPNPPTNVSTGGPAGAGDRFVQNISTGGFGPGSRQIMFNQVQWTGDYIAAGVSGLEMDLINLGQTDMTIHITMVNNDLVNGLAAFSTTAGFNLPVGSGWQHATFSLLPADMTLVAGSLNHEQVLSGITEVRILANNGPGFLGAPIAATLGTDNITAIPEPAAALGVVGLGALALRRRR